MRRLIVGATLVIMMGCASAASAATSPSPPATPSLSTTFQPSTVSLKGTSQLTFTLRGGDEPYTAIDLRATIPAGLTIAGSSSSRCGGTLTTTPVNATPVPNGSATAITLSGGSLAAGGTCSFSVPVETESAGQLDVVTSVQATDAANASVQNQTIAMLTVPAIAAPATVTSSFSPDAFSQFDNTTWTVAITNPNPSTTLTGVRFLVGIPIFSTAPLIPEAVTENSCGGTGILTTGLVPYTDVGPSINYGGGTVAPGTTCTISVLMQDRASVPVDPGFMSVTVVSDEGGASAVSKATLTSFGPRPVASPPSVNPPNQPSVPPPHPSRRPSNAFTHSRPRVARDGTITETVKPAGRGILHLRELWRAKLIARVQKTVRTASTLTIRLVPRAPARRAMKARRVVTVRLLVSFRPTGGKTRTTALIARTPRRPPRPPSSAKPAPA